MQASTTRRNFFAALFAPAVALLIPKKFISNNTLFGYGISPQRMNHFRSRRDLGHSCERMRCDLDDDEYHEWINARIRKNLDHPWRVPEQKDWMHNPQQIRRDS
jgi:hypothetical protein